MEKRLIATMVAAAFAGTAGVAVAGPISVASIGTYASETIGAAAGNILLGNVAYTLSSPFAIASTQTIEYVLGNSAKVAVCPTVAIIDAISNAAPIGVTIGAAAKSGSSCKYSITTTTNAVPAQSLVNFTAASADPSAGPLLASGGSLTTTVNVYNSLGNVVESNNTQVAVAAQALSASWLASAPAGSTGVFTTAELSKVDVTASPVATLFTNPTDVTSPSLGVNGIVLGAYQLKNNTGTFLDSNGVAVVDISKLTTNKATLTVTGPFVANTNLNAVFASSKADCSDNKGSFTVAGNTATATIDAIAAGLSTATPQSIFVCYAPQTGLAKAVQIPTGQFSGSGSTASATAVTTSGMQGESATGPLYNLLSNGASVDVRVMTTAATTGWSTVLRIINTGSLAAPVTATLLLNDGTVGNSGQIIASLAAGATAMLSSAQVEAALGAALPLSGNPPRIRISAPTDSLRVQAWVQQPNGAWFMGTPGQESEAAGAPVAPTQTK